VAARRAAPVPAVIRAEISPPPGTAYDLDVRLGGPVELSHDGTRLVFAARDALGRSSLWVRDLAASAAVELEGTAGGSYPFWSPDGRFVGYFVAGDLRKVAVNGGPPLTLCPAPFGKGGTWGRDGTIVFSQSFATGLHRVSAGGGDSRPVTTLDEQAGENSHRFPQLLPDGRHFLYFARRAGGAAGTVGGGTIMIGSLDGGAPRRLVEAPASGVFADGWLLFPRQGALVAQRLDGRSLALVGEPRPLVADLRVTPGTSRSVVTASSAGTLAYQTAEAAVPMRVELWNWSGGKQRDVGEPGPYGNPRLSPDGRRAAVLLADENSGWFSVWLLDLERGARTNLTTGVNQERPVWSSDGRFLYFSRSVPPGRSVIFRLDLGAGRREERIEIAGRPDGPLLPLSVSPDGLHLLFENIRPESGFDLWTTPLDGSGPARALVATAADDAAGAFAPNGRWCAYHSEESGRREVYVASFPDGRVRQQVSLEGGSYPAWRPDGGRLVWASHDGTIVGASVRGVGGELDIGPIETVARVGPALQRFDAGRDGLLVVSAAAPTAVRNLHLIVNWTQLLR
jgi:Tol biopolymer transport system component